MRIIPQEMKSSLQSLKFNLNSVPDMEIVEVELYNALSDSKGSIREMCSHVLNAGGKRVRPMLVLYSGMAFSKPAIELVNAAVAAELIHMASLVHDDIIDDSALRRNKPSANKIWGKHFSVLCGDYLFAKAFGILSGNRLIRSMDFMVYAIQNMCHGEIQQAAGRFQEVSMEEYYERITQKTAIFLECCCKSGAAIAGANDLQVQLMGEYGLNLGLAFQIIDDIMDFCGDPAVMGKPKYEDLRQGNITMPAILLFKDDRYGEWIREIAGKKQWTRQILDEVAAVLETTGIIEKSFEAAAVHIDKAKHCLSLLPESANIEFLNNVADMLQARIN